MTFRNNKSDPELEKMTTEQMAAKGIRYMKISLFFGVLLVIYTMIILPLTH